MSNVRRLNDEFFPESKPTNFLNESVRSQLWFDALPVVIEPTLDGFQLLPLLLWNFLPGRLIQDLERNVLLFEYS